MNNVRWPIGKKKLPFKKRLWQKNKNINNYNIIDDVIVIIVIILITIMLVVVILLIAIKIL